MKNPGKILMFFGIFAATATLALIIATTFKYFQTKNNNFKFENPVFTLSPQKNIRLGDSITASAMLICPWSCRPEGASAVSGKGSQLVSKPEISLSKIGWGFWTWRISVGIQPFLTGKIEEGKVEIKVNSLGAGKDLLLPTIPSFESSALETGNSKELNLAGTMNTTGFFRKNFVIITLAVMLSAALILAVVLLVRKNTAKKNIPPISCWELALLQLCEIRRKLREQQMAADLCVAKLTDIVRNYLEKRFKLHAPAQTTSEFLGDLNKNTGPLKIEDREFLGNFLAAADLVKFAKVPADLRLLENAFDKAESLVVSTTPAETPPANPDRERKKTKIGSA